jgi:vacuolar-type H+-ATPase subunit H
MRIFEWVNDIEKVYQQLIDKARQENSLEIQVFKEQQENLLKEMQKKNHDLVNLSLESLSEDVISGIRSYEEKIDEALQKIKNDYQKKKNKLINQMIEELGVSF